MGLTYQELKRLGKNSIVLEKQENTDIQQNSSGYCSKKRRLIREKFFRDHRKETESHSVGKYIPKKRDKLDSAKASEVISKLCLHSLVLEEKKNKRFEEKVDKTSMHLDYLQQVINNEIKKLKNQRSNLVMKMKEEKADHDEDFTWAENLANNCPLDRKPVTIAKEKFSAQHQGVFTSPRYGSNQDVALRPRTRSVASQIDTLPMDTDKGAVGDHNSFNSFDYNKVRGPSKSIIDVLLTPSIHRKQDQIVNCCYHHTFHPVAECYNTAGVGVGTGGFVCHHRNIQQSSVEPHSEYKYCCNEYCYNYNPCNQSPALCYCATPASSKHINIGACRSCYGRHGTDLDTDKFYCRSKSKSERTIAARRHKHQETCDEYGERKKRECREKLYKKREKLQRNLSREAMLPNSSMIVQHLDRYVDERKKCVESFLKKHTKLARNFYEDSSTSTVKISSESKICRITVQSKPNEHYDDASINSRYSVETLRMLKRMKIRKYVASKPNSRDKDKDDTARHVQKMKKYQEYLEKYRNEERSSIVKQTSNEQIQILKEPPQVFAAPDSEKLLQQHRTSKNLSPSNEQPQTNVRQQRESSISNEPTGESTNKRRNLQSLEKDESYEELRYEYGAGKPENSVSISRDSKVLEKLDTKTHRESKDNDNKSYNTEKVNKEYKDQEEEEERPYKYRSSRDNERESIVNKDLGDREIRNCLKDQKDGVHRATYDNYKPEEISPLKSDKRSMEYDRGSYRESIIKQSKQTDHENGYRISDDNKLTRQYRPSFLLNDPPQVLEESEPRELLQQDKATSTLSFIGEQPQNAVIPLRESYYSKELTEQSTSKRRSSQPLERESGYEELRDSKAFEKLDTKTHRDSKDYDYKPYGKEKGNRESDDYQEARSDKYRTSKDKQRESMVNKDLYDSEIRKSLKNQKDGVYRASYDNYKPEDISPQKTEKRSIEYVRGSYREPVIKQSKETKNENGHRISDDTEYTEQYRSSFLLNEPPQVVEKSECEDIAMQDLIARTFSISREQPQNSVRQPRESNFNKELTEQPMSKRRSTQPSERYADYEELRDSKAFEKPDTITSDSKDYDYQDYQEARSSKYRRSKDKERESMVNKDLYEEEIRKSFKDQRNVGSEVLRDSKAFEKLETKTHRDSKDNDNKSYDTEQVNNESKDHEEERSYKYRSSNDSERESIANKDLYDREIRKCLNDQKDVMYRTSRDNYKPEEISPLTSEKRSAEYFRKSYREPIIQQGKETDHENDYRISDDKKLTEQYHPSFLLNDPPQVVEKLKCEELALEDLIARTFSISREQRQNSVRQPRESNFNKELSEQSTSRRRSTQPLERYAGYEELRDSKAFEKPDTITHRDSKDYGYQDYQEARSSKYSRSKNKERESIINKDLYEEEIRKSLKDQKDGVYRSSYDNYKPVEVSPLESYREPIIQQEKETDHKNGYSISKEIEPRMLTKRSTEYDKDSYRESKTEQKREAYYENGQRISDDKQPIEQYHSSFCSCEPPQIFEEPEPGKLLQQGEATNTLSFLEEQPKSTVRLLRESYYDKEPIEQFTNNRRTTQPLEVYEDLRYDDDDLRRAKSTVSDWNNREQDTNAFEKRDTNIQRGSKAYDDKLDYQEERLYMYRSSKDNERGEGGGNLKEQQDKSKEILLRNSEKRVIVIDDHSSVDSDFLSNDHPQVIKKSETFYRKEPSKQPRKNIFCCCTKPLERDESYKNLSESKAFEKLDKKSKDIERESNVNKYLHDKYNMESLKEPNNREHGTFVVNDGTKEISPRKLTKQRIEYDKESDENNHNLSDEKLKALNRSSFRKNPEPYRARQEHDNYPQLSLQVKNADMDDERKQRETFKASTSFSYRDFRETMDHNIGFYSETSSQANYTTENDLMQPESAKTFTKEMKAEKEPYMRQNTKEALQYLRGFLNSYQQFDLDDECLNSVRTAAQDLINKLSSCKMNKSTDATSEGETTSRTEYKDPESIPNTSRHQLEQEKGNKVNDNNNGANTITEKESPYHSDNQHWKPTKKYQRYLEYKQQTITSSTPSVGLINEDDHYQYSSSSQMPDSSQYLHNVSESLLTHDNKYGEEAPNEYDTNLPLSSYESEYYQSYRPQSRPTSVYSREVMPIKGILKPSRAMGNIQKVSCDLVTNATVSTHNFEQASQINMRRDTLLKCAQGQQEIEHQSNESFQTVIANDQCMQPFVEQTEHRHTIATTTREPLYEEDTLQNNYVSNYDEADNNRFLYTVGLPNFRQCPCMLKTYLQMLETYYRAGNK